MILYHYLADGRAYGQLRHGSRRDLGPGDVVIFPHGDAHVLGNGAGKPVDSLKTFAQNLNQGLKVARYGGGGELTKFVCGYMACDPSLSEVILAGLPSMFVVNIANGSAGQWLAKSIQFSVREAEGPGTGSDVVLVKLSEVLFIETLRRFIQDLPDEQKGWLAGARDPVIGEALALLHKNPSHPWTIANLAHQVGVSRTRFAERFRHFLGERRCRISHGGDSSWLRKDWCLPTRTSARSRPRSAMHRKRRSTASSSGNLAVRRRSSAAHVIAKQTK